MGIKGKMLLSIIITMTISFSILGYIILSKSTTALNNVAQKQAETKAGELIGRVRSNLEKSETSASILAIYFAEFVDSGITDRAVVNKMVSGALLNSPSIVNSAFTLWETNAFDGRDSEYANKNGTDGTGRLMTRYYRSGDGGKLMSYDSGSSVKYDSYYDEVKSTMSNICSEPYYSDVNGIETVCFTIASPIVSGSRFLGIAGIEISTADFQALVESLAGDDMDVWLLSNNGTYVASTDNSLLMKSISFSGELSSALAAGDNYSEIENGIYRAYSPFTITGTSTPWSISVGVNKTSAQATSLLTLGLIMFVVIFVLILVIITVIANTIAKPIIKISDYAQSMAEGNLDFEVDKNANIFEIEKLSGAMYDVKMSVSAISGTLEKTSNDIIAGNLTNRTDSSKFPGEFGNIMEGLNKIQDSIAYLIKNIKESAENVSSASQQISGGAQDLAQGSTEQAAALEEISATVAEVVEQTRINSDGATTARGLAEKVHMEAENGNEKMKQLLVALEEINQASADISNIIKTIEDIAFQTNILALNASVEAARAGVHGKGFAVVAEEVKNLATKSAEAAKETNALINTSITKSKGGVTIGESMRGSLDSMVSSIVSAVAAIKQIADASKQQVDVIEQLNSGIEQISQVVQTNTAAAEESASSSEEMSAQAEMLHDLVKKYRVNGENAE